MQARSYYVKPAQHGGDKIFDSKQFLSSSAEGRRKGSKTLADDMAPQMITDCRNLHHRIFFILKYKVEKRSLNRRAAAQNISP